MSTTSIIIPVYNEINFIRRTLLSIEGQADEIIITDNASTDGTTEVCQAFAAAQNNVVYKRQPKNYGGAKNFADAFALSSGDYSILIGGHDMLSKNYVSALKALLDDNPDAVCAYAPCVHVDSNYAFKRIYEYPFYNKLASNNASERVWTVLNNVDEGSSYYGLYRRSIFSEVKERLTQNYPYEITDANEMLEYARIGKWLFCPEATLYRIDPRVPDQSFPQFVTRVMKTIYMDQYDPSIHIAERFPMSYADTMFDAILSVAHLSENQEAYIDKCVKRFMEKWAFSENARCCIVNILKKKGISIDKQNTSEIKKNKSFMQKIFNSLRKLSCI